MTHRMSLAKITLKYKAGIVTTKNYTWNNSASVQNNGTTNVMASNSFNTTEPYVKPYYSATESNEEIYYYVAKYDEKPQLIDNDATEYKKWTSVITIQNASSQSLGKGNYAAFTATSRAENRAWCYYVGDFPYRGNYQQFTTPIAGVYKLECWGASGGYCLNNIGGSGAYTKGEISLSASCSLYLYVGGIGGSNPKPLSSSSLTAEMAGGWNGGGNGGTADTRSHGRSAGGGGGATDIRTTNGAWNNSNSLNSRIMVAGAGGGGEGVGYESTLSKDNSSHGGGLLGYAGLCCNYADRYVSGGNQSSGGSRVALSSVSSYNSDAPKFTDSDIASSGYTGGGKGYGGHGSGKLDAWNGGGGGSGYYGGSGGCSYVHHWRGESTCGGGGSSYISGHPGCATISGYAFTSGTTKMIDGMGLLWTTSGQTTGGSAEQMPNPTGGFYDSGKGHVGNGYARITFVSE